MGISALWPRLDQVPVRYATPADLFQRPVSNAPPTLDAGHTTIPLYFPDVDLFATHLPEILDLIYQERGNSLTPHELGLRFGRRILARYPVPAVTSLHMDGQRTLEKEGTHAERSDAKRKEQERLTSCLDSMERRSEMGKLMAKRTMHDIERLLRRSFSLDTTFKESFIKGLQEVYPDSHVCRTESDTCIAECAEQKKFEGQVWNRVVVSNDSDSLIYPTIGKVLRKLPRGGGYGLYPKEAVVRSLQLPSLHHLTVLGIVSNNDYSANLPIHGLATNLAILRRHPNLTDPRAILLEYQDYVRSYLEYSSGYFEPAYAIFVERADTPIASSTSNNSFYLEMEGRFRDLKELRYRVRKRIEMTKQDNDTHHHVPKKAAPNRFRPIFTGTSATLKGRVVKDIAKTTPRDHPPKRPRPPKVPQQKPLNVDKSKDDGNITAKSRMDKGKGKDNPSIKEGQMKKPITARPKRISQATIDDKAIRLLHPLRVLSIGSVGGALCQQFNDVYARTLLNYLWTVLSSRSSGLDSSMSREDILPSTPLYYRGSVEQAVAKIVKAFPPSGPPGQVPSFATKPSADSSNSSPTTTTTAPLIEPLGTPNKSQFEAGRLQLLLLTASGATTQCDSTTTPATLASCPSQPPDVAKSDADRLRESIAAASGTTSQCDSTTTPSTPAPRPSQPLDKASSSAVPPSQPTSTGQSASNKCSTSQAIKDTLNQLPSPSLLRDFPWASRVALNLRSVYRCKGFASAVAEWIHGYAMTDSRKIQTEIVKAVDLCNQVQVYLYYAFALFVKALKMKSSLPPCPSKSHSTTGKISTAKLWDQQLPWRPDDTTFTERTLAMIIDDPGFLTSLTRQLYSGERSQMSRLKSDTTFLDAATAAMIAYGFFVEQTGFGPLRSMAELPFGNIANMISKPVHTALKSHYSKARFDTDGTDTSLSDISYFFLHNGSVSPHGQQNQSRADFPKATLTPGSVCLSESNIIDILWANKNTKALLQFSLRTKLVPLNFKTKQDFQYVHDEYRGIVTEVVFGHGDYKRTDFMRNRAIQPASQDVQQYSTVDRGHPGDQRARTRHWLKGTVVTDGLVLYRLAYDASITKTLRQQQQSQTQEDDDFDDDDGLDLVDLADEQELDSLDAEDLEAVMKEAGLEMDHGLGSTDIDPGRNSASGGNVSHTSPLRHLKADIEPTPDPLPDPASFLDPACSSISSASVPDPAWTRWTAGTRLLPNIELSFSSAEVCPDPCETIVFGWDAGERKSAVIVCRDPKDPNRRHVLTISRGFLWRPALMFRRLLRNRKTNTLAPDGGKSFAQLESGIPTFSLENLNTFFSYIRSPIGSFSSVLETLIHFYREPWFRRNRWESKKAQVAALDYAVESILNMAQRTITTKDSNNVEKKETIKGSTWGLDKRLPPIVVCIGLAKFNSRTGLPSKHGVLIKRFVQKARPLGIIIVGANEFFTSAKCPREDCNCFLESNQHRSKYCRACRMDYDRDAVGAENISTICLSQLRTQHRPPKFMPQPLEPDPPPPPTPPKPPVPRKTRPRSDETLLGIACKKSRQ